MVPHSLFVASDRQFDLSLQLLTLVVIVAIVLSLLTLVHNAFAPQQPPDRGDIGPPTWAAMPESLIDPWQLEPSLLRPEPRDRDIFYRCDRNGRTIYSDEPCRDGAMRIVIPRTS